MKLLETSLLILMLFTTAAVAAIAANDTSRLATAGGQIASIDPAAKSLTVKVDDQTGKARDLTLVVADDSKIVKDGAAVTLKDLKQGDKVTVTYRAEAGKNVVVNIGVERT